ncbi:MAG: NADH-quinone oxidoreductase subunit M [Acidobacteria bacterium]|nr:NADH-quinone oxidoreductase subunit M [Acidobacteriota bacterium]MBV9187238.1 NADH-quinone oxidoreductase subunit M [Acidobacteriota bacterium]
MGILNLVTYIPLIGAIVILFFVRKENGKAIRYTATAFAVIDFIVSLYLWFNFDPHGTGTHLFQFRETYSWIPSLGVQYDFGIDGISLLLILLTTFMGIIAVVSSYSAIDHRQKEYYILLLLLQTGMIGTFCALDFFLFYVFWEIMLVPMYFIIGIWGGPRKLYAAIKFFIYTLSGSVVMLLSILALYFFNDGGIPFLNIKGLGNPATFSVLQYHNIGHLIPPQLQFWIFIGFFLGFAIKVPMFPFHTWLPDAHVEAPTAGSIILAAVLLKMGTYGFVRFALPILPDATKQLIIPIVVLSIIGIIYGALVSLVQKDMKKLVAYSSVSHLGFVMLGMFALNPMGLKGSVLQMINHGISTGALFLLVGIIYERRHTRMISEYGGLAKQMPMYATLFLIAALSSMGLPALNGFIGEFTILLGAANRSIVWASFASVGIVLGAAYLLWLYQRVFWGPLDNPANKTLLDVNRRELGLLLALVVIMVWMGIKPAVFFDVIEEPVNYVVRKVDPAYFDKRPIEYPPAAPVVVSAVETTR